MYISILGDSISTYQDCIPPGHAAFYDSATALQNGLHSVHDTWWDQVIHHLSGTLCVNDSYSGSRVSGTAFPAACSVRRTGALHTDAHRPDLILLYIGFNDFGFSVPIRGFTDRSFAHAYNTMLRRLRWRYPGARILCGTLMKTTMEHNPYWECVPEEGLPTMEHYNQAIRGACRRQGCILADLAALDIPYETLDGTHPTAAGHRTIAQCWIACMKDPDGGTP